MSEPKIENGVEPPKRGKSSPPQRPSDDGVDSTAKSAGELMAESSRANRDHETREGDYRPSDSWVPQSKLPVPKPQDGWRFKWVATTILGQDNIQNVSSRLREGWVSVTKEEAEHLFDFTVLTDLDTRFPDNIVIGGLMLCKLPEERAQAREAHFSKLARGQVEAIDSSLLNESDPRMPIDVRERQTKVQFGRGN